jgi:hypothetical protein
MAQEDNNQLRDMIRTAVAAGPDCLNSAQLEECLEHPESQLFSHVRYCPRCSTELALLRSFEASTPLPQEGAAVSWITAQLERRPAYKQNAGRPIRSAEKEKSRLIAFLPRLASAFALIAVVAVGLIFYQGQRTHEPGIQGPLGGSDSYRSGRLEVIQPVGDVTLLPSAIRWEPVANASKYSVILMEVDKNVLWSGATFDSFVTITPELASKIEKRKPILLEVEAQDSSGKVLARSSPIRFRLVPPPTTASH